MSLNKQIDVYVSLEPMALHCSQSSVDVNFDTLLDAFERAIQSPLVFYFEHLFDTALAQVNDAHDRAPGQFQRLLRALVRERPAAMEQLLADNLADTQRSRQSTSHICSVLQLTIQTLAQSLTSGDHRLISFAQLLSTAPRFTVPTKRTSLNVIFEAAVEIARLLDRDPRILMRKVKSSRVYIENRRRLRECIGKGLRAALNDVAIQIYASIQQYVSEQSVQQADRLQQINQLQQKDNNQNFETQNMNGNVNVATAADLQRMYEKSTQSYSPANTFSSQTSQHKSTSSSTKNGQKRFEMNNPSDSSTSTPEGVPLHIVEQQMKQEKKNRLEKEQQQQQQQQQHVQQDQQQDQDQYQQTHPEQFVNDSAENLHGQTDLLIAKNQSSKSPRADDQQNPIAMRSQNTKSKKVVVSAPRVVLEQLVQTKKQNVPSQQQQQKVIEKEHRSQQNASNFGHQPGAPPMNPAAEQDENQYDFNDEFLAPDSEPQTYEDENQTNSELKHFGETLEDVDLADYSDEPSDAETL